MEPLAVVAALVAAVAIAAVAAVQYRRGRRDLGTRADRTTFQTLHTAAQAAPALRGGLTAAGAQRAVKHLRALLGTTAVAITDGERLLAWDGAAEQAHAHQAV